MKTYRGYKVEPKLDFGSTGFLIRGEWVKTGFVVVKGGVNVMPGACWFQTYSEACEAIDALELAGGPDSKCDANIFWLLLHHQGLSETYHIDGSVEINVKPKSKVLVRNGKVSFSALTLTPTAALELAGALYEGARIALEKEVKV